MAKLTLSRKGQPDWTNRSPVTRYRAGQPNRLRHPPAWNGAVPSSSQHLATCSTGTRQANMNCMKTVFLSG
jgi:hypothetical protein